MGAEAVRDDALHVGYTGASRLTLFGAKWAGRTMPAAIACRFDELGSEMDALLDTGAQYCVMRSDVAVELSLDLAAEPHQTILWGSDRIEGVLRKYWVRIPALLGEDIEVEATWFVSEDYDGPMVLGWVAFLDSLDAFGCKLGVRPDEESLFHFSLEQVG